MIAFIRKIIDKFNQRDRVPVGSTTASLYLEGKRQYVLNYTILNRTEYADCSPTLVSPDNPTLAISYAAETFSCRLYVNITGSFTEYIPGREGAFVGNNYVQFAKSSGLTYQGLTEFDLDNSSFVGYTFDDAVTWVIEIKRTQGGNITFKKL